jgi:hypothetical protein
LITCFIRYSVDPNKVAEFEHYARVWMRLIEKYGGTHHGYFMPGEGLPLAAFSFPGIGEEGPGGIAVALFTFLTVEAYETYRREVATDPECLVAAIHYEKTRCFTKYERTFLRPVPR